MGGWNKQLKKYLWEVFVNGILSSRIVGWRTRRLFLKILGIETGKGSAIHSGIYISGSKLRMGDYSYINSNCMIDSCHAPVIIGNYVGIGYSCKFFTTNHDCSNAQKRSGRVEGRPIMIGDGVWIGGGVTVCPGVTIGSGCVIGAGSVVVRDCGENGLYVGNPAKRIRLLE